MPQTYDRYRSIASVLCVSVLLTVAPGWLLAQRPLVLDSLSSASLSQTRTFGLLLPDSFDTGRQYPVLYLLHGYSGGFRDWFDRTDVESYVEDTPLIVVFPDADDSWYVDSPAGERYEQYVMKDLFDLIESRYPIDPQKRAVAGLSMGGYGSLLYGMKYPGRFSFAGSFSGAITFPSLIGDTIRQPLSKGITNSLQKSFGPVETNARLDDDLYSLLRRAPADSLPFFYMATGIQDGYVSILPGHHRLADSLRSMNARYEYHETQGRHSWSYWDHELKRMLPVLKEILEY